MAKSPADLSVLVDTVYRLDLPDEVCAHELAHAVGRAFAPGAPVAASVAQSKNSGVFLTSAGDRAFVEGVAAAASGLPRAVWSLRPDFYDPIHMYRNVPDALATLAALGARAALGFWCPTGRGKAFQVFVFVQRPKRSTATPRSSPRHREVANHLATGWRLRDALKSDPLATVEGVFSPDGSALHLEAVAVQAGAGETLSRIVRQRERGRSARAAEREPLWPALIMGRWTLVDQIESDGRRFVVACRNAVPWSVRNAIKDVDSILNLAFAGESNKAIGLELGLQEPEVSRRLSRILRDLRIDRMFDAMKLSRTVARRVDIGGRRTRDQLLITELPPDAVHGLAHLTPAEVDVLTSIAHENTLADIAERRGRSVQTVANQASRAFAKIGISGCRELQCLLSGEPSRNI